MKQLSISLSRTHRQMKGRRCLIALALALTALPTRVWAAACCGGGFALPALIAGDDKAQLSGSYSYSQVAVDNVDANGVWREWEHHQQVQMFRLEGAHLLGDRWQAGFAVPVMERSHLSQTYSGFADVSGSLGYEYLPDWEYHPFRPRGLGFLQLTLPTGKSKAESENGALDSRGNGFLALGLGTLLSKALGDWDGFLSLEAHRSFNKQVHTSEVDGTLQPGFGSNFGFGGGYNTVKFRFGGSLIWTYEDPIHIDGSSPSNGSLERYATATAVMSYLVSDQWATILSYSDQTLFGYPVNTSLGRTVSLQLQRHWSR